MPSFQSEAHRGAGARPRSARWAGRRAARLLTPACMCPFPPPPRSPHQACTSRASPAAPPPPAGASTTTRSCRRSPAPRTPLQVRRHGVRGQARGGAAARQRLTHGPGAAPPPAAHPPGYQVRAPAPAPAARRTPAVVATFVAIRADRAFGRHRLLLAGGACYLVASPLQAAAPATTSGLAMIIVGRCFVGCGMALANQAGPVSDNGCPGAGVGGAGRQGQATPRGEPRGLPASPPAPPAVTSEPSGPPLLPARPARPPLQAYLAEISPPRIRARATMLVALGTVIAVLSERGRGAACLGGRRCRRRAAARCPLPGNERRRGARSAGRLPVAGRVCDGGPTAGAGTAPPAPPHRRRWHRPPGTAPPRAGTHGAGAAPSPARPQSPTSSTLAPPTWPATAGACPGR